MKLDNVDLIRGFLDFPNEDVFYFVQVMNRKKDCGYDRIIKSFYIHSPQDYDNKVKEIKTLCDTFGARAYIHPNRKSFEKTTLQSLKEMADLVLNRDFYQSKSVFDSVCGKFSNEDSYNHERGKLWLIDIDTKDEESIKEVSDFIKTLKRGKTTFGEIVLSVPTKNGVHLITTTFDLITFRKKFPNIDIHKNNPTLLYYDDGKC